MKKILLTLFAAGCLFTCSAQTELSLKWNLMQHANSQDSLVIDELRCYVSNISLWQDTTLIWQDPISAHLIDLADSTTCLMQLPDLQQKKFNLIKFNLGIDSTTNVSGAMGGDLDPTKGMYWTWQSGYINMKIEGHRSKAFQYHIGGYAAPNNALQEVKLHIVDQHNTNIYFDSQALIAFALAKGFYHIMSPSTAACQLAQKAAQLFSIQ
jgi:hypothetical protein